MYGPNNKSVGEVEDVIMGQGQQQPGYAVISFGGFLGLGAEQVAIPLSAIRISEDNYLFVDFDRNRLESGAEDPPRVDEVADRQLRVAPAERRLLHRQSVTR